MADIVIMGMDLGNTMVSCPFRANDGYGNFYCVAGHTDCHAPFDERPEDCKVTILPERHGRLGDLDALMEIIRAHDYPLTAHFNSTDNGMFTQGIQQAVDEVPTIIPAEGGTTNDGNA